MATLSLANISDALSLVYRDRIVNSINRQVVLLNLLPIVNAGGKVSNWTAKFTGRANAAGYTEGADMGASDFDSELRVAATLAWAQYRKGAKVSGLAQAVQATNHNAFSTVEYGEQDIMEDESADAIHRLALGIGEDLYGGTGGGADPLIGIATAIDSTGTYAGINQATYGEWASTEQTGLLAGLSFSMLRAFHTAIYEAGGEMPEYCVCPSAIFDAIGDLFGSERRYLTEVTVSDVKGNPKSIKLSGGFKALEIDGVPYVRDRFATANTIYAMNNQHCRIEQIPAYISPMTYERFADVMMQITGDRPTEAEYGEMTAKNSGLRPFVNVLAQLGDSQRLQVKWYGQLQIRRRNGFGKLTLS